MTAEIWRVAINQIAFRCLTNDVTEVGENKLPIAGLHRFADVINLVADFGDVSLSKSFGLVPVRGIKSTLAVEANNAIET